MIKELTIRNSTVEFLIFEKQAHADSIEVRYEDETLWLTQKMMSNLFDVSTKTISEHLANIYDFGELDRDRVSVIGKFSANTLYKPSFHEMRYHINHMIFYTCTDVFTDWTAQKLIMKLITARKYLSKAKRRLKWHL